MNTREYNSCVDEFSDRVFRFAVKTLKQEMLAQDIVQEAYTRLWEKKDNVDFSKARSYLFQTAYNLMVDHFRENKRYSDSPLRVERGDSMENPDLKEILKQALDTLPQIQKTVLMLRDYEGYNYGEIGEITDLNESQVKVYIFRARKAMKEFIGSIHNVI